MKWYAKLYTRLIFIFLYLPIIVLIIFSFNESKSRAHWAGFSFHWYRELFHNELILSSLRNTLIIALASSVIALVLGMVYNYLPFMVIPLYSIMTKIEPYTLEAAGDLGANPWNTFTRVVLPLSVPGITTGITMVFVPSVSTFIISRMLGGGSNMMVGDLIETQFLGNAYNPNLGSAISLVLMVFILLVMSLMNQFEDNDDRGGMLI